MTITVRRPIHHYSPAREIRWRRRSILAIILLVSAVLQGAGGGSGVLFHFRPDLVLIVVVCWSLREGPGGGWRAGAAGGLLSDLFSAGMLGGNALSLAAAGWLAALASRSLYRGHLTTKIVMVAFAALASGVIYYLLLVLFRSPPPWPASWRLILWPRLWQTTLISPLWLLPVDRLLGGRR